jgi:hypothetical protein
MIVSCLEQLRPSLYAYLDKASAVVQMAEAHYRTKLTDIADLRQLILQKAFARKLP